MAKHRAKKNSLRDRFADTRESLRFNLRYYPEEIWQGAFVIFMVIVVMAIAIYLVAYGGWH
jgi:hypothetical protein